MAFLNNLKCTRLCKFQYQQQLEQLEKLGYTDTKHIKKKLKQYNGNANQVIADYLKDDDASAMNEETTDYVELLRVALTQLKLIYIEDLCNRGQALSQNQTESQHVYYNIGKRRTNAIKYQE
eukprot:83892_1